MRMALAVELHKLPSEIDTLTLDEAAHLLGMIKKRGPKLGL